MGGALRATVSKGPSWTGSGQRRAQLSGLFAVAPAFLIVCSLLLPVEVRVTLAGQTFYAYRIVWILLLPWLFTQIVRGSIRFRLNDLLLTFASAWMVISFVVLYGFARGLPSSLGFALDILVPYLIVRASIVDLQAFRRLLVLVAPVVLVFAMLLPLESLTQTRFIRSGAQAIFGGLSAAEYGSAGGPLIANDTRYGLLRAMGPFSHPILAGLFFASLLPLYYFSRLRGWPLFAGFISGLAAVFSLSSAAVLGLVSFFLLAAYDWIRTKVAFLTWSGFIYATAALLAAAHVLSQNGLVYVLIRLTLNPRTGYYRLLIWEYGTLSVQKHPWFGIGYSAFEALSWMGQSVDAFYLAIAIRYGLPASLLLVLATLLALFGIMAKAGREKGADQRTLIGLAITMTILFIQSFTVSFFGGLLIWFALLLGITTNLGEILPRKASAGLPADGGMRRPLPYRGRR